MDYRESVDYVTNAPLFGARKNGLENIRALLDGLGNPQNRLRAVHVAGTNGKGSVCAYTDAILRAAGYRTGLYTSPYLERFTERFRIDGREIDPADFARIATRVRAAAERMTAGGLTHPTFFELITAACFLYFAEAAVDAAVVETGLGGRLDATNVVHPAVSVITAISRDHVRILGDTVAEIAREKAGIIKPAVPAVAYPQADPEAWAELLAAARGAGSPLYAVAGCHIVVEHSGLDGQDFTLAYQGLRFSGLHIGLLGRYQILNAATALMTALVLRQHGQFALTQDHIRTGLAAAVWPGRMEVLSRDPYVVVDGAHNPEGIVQLRKAIEDLFPGERAVVVCGILRTKEAGAMTRDLAAMAAEVIVTRPDSGKAFSCEELNAFFEGERVTVSARSDAADALEAGLARARETRRPLVVAGSLYLAGAARAWFIRRAAGENAAMTHEIRITDSDERKK